MREKLVFKREFEEQFLVLDEDCDIRRVTYGWSRGNSIEISNGRTYSAVCIRCEDKPCMNLSRDDVEVNILNGLPFNPSRRVCPTNAISITNSGGIAIDSERCIGCAVCYNRCPVAGIGYDVRKGSFKVLASEDCGPYEVTTHRRDPRINSTYQKALRAGSSVEIDVISRSFAARIKEGFGNFKSHISDLELILVRNLLLQLGVPSMATAQGNNDARPDLIGAMGDFVLCIESELSGSDVLGLPRRTLENVTWLKSRQGVSLSSQIPVMIIFNFPRKRSDFYEVVLDVENVLGIQMKTLGLHSLLVMALFRQKFTPSGMRRDFNINIEHPDIGPDLKKYIPGIEEIDQSFGGELYSFTK